jgi:hypothetical protein
LVAKNEQNELLANALPEMRKLLLEYSALVGATGVNHAQSP